MKKTFALLLALTMALMLFPAGAMAAGTVKTITTPEQLADAILAQADGQTWNLAANTTFDLTGTQVDQYMDLEINGSKAFIFPITADNLTINGGPGTVITTSKLTNTGNWNYQNFITIGGDNVTLNGLTLIPGWNQYDDDANGINKIIEVLGINSVIKNIRTQPRNDGDFSGSIYYSNADKKSIDVLENVYLCRGRISLGGKTNGTLKMTNVTIDFVNAMKDPAYKNWGGFKPHPTNPGVDYEVNNVKLIMTKYRITEYEKLDGRPDLETVIADGSTEVKATVDPAFIIVIPAKVEFGTLAKSTAVVEKPFPVEAKNVVIEESAKIDVSVQSGFQLRNAGGAALLAYQLLNEAGTNVPTGTAYCSFTGDAVSTGEVTVNTANIKNAGSYSDTMIFTIDYLSANPDSELTKLVGSADPARFADGHVLVDSRFKTWWVDQFTSVEVSIFKNGVKLATNKLKNPGAIHSQALTCPFYQSTPLESSWEHQWFVTPVFENPVFNGAEMKVVKDGKTYIFTLTTPIV